MIKEAEERKKGRPAGAEGAFDPNWVQAVKDARSTEGSEPQSSPGLQVTEQKQLMLHLWWEDTAVILQRKRVLTGREGREFDWNKLGDMKEEEVETLIGEDIRRKDIVIVIDEEDLKIIGKVMKVIRVLDPERIGVLMAQTAQRDLFPAGPEMAEKIPWPTRMIARFTRQLQSEAPAEAKWYLAATSTRDSRANKLQPEYRTIRLQKAGEEPSYNQNTGPSGCRKQEKSYAASRSRHRRRASTYARFRSVPRRRGR